MKNKVNQIIDDLGAKNIFSYQQLLINHKTINCIVTGNSPYYFNSDFVNPQNIVIELTEDYEQESFSFISQSMKVYNEYRYKGSLEVPTDQNAVFKYLVNMTGLSSHYQKEVCLNDIYMKNKNGSSKKKRTFAYPAFIITIIGIDDKKYTTHDYHTSLHTNTPILVKKVLVELPRSIKDFGFQVNIIRECPKWWDDVEYLYNVINAYYYY